MIQCWLIYAKQTKKTYIHIYFLIYHRTKLDWSYTFLGASVCVRPFFPFLSFQKWIRWHLCLITKCHLLNTRGWKGIQASALSKKPNSSFSPWGTTCYLKKIIKIIPGMSSPACTWVCVWDSDSDKCTICPVYPLVKSSQTRTANTTHKLIFFSFSQADMFFQGTPSSTQVQCDMPTTQRFTRQQIDSTVSKSLFVESYLRWSNLKCVGFNH